MNKRIGEQIKAFLLKYFLCFLYPQAGNLIWGSMCWSHPYVLHPENHNVLYAMLILLHASVSVRVQASMCVCFSISPWRPGCTEMALPASRAPASPSALLMTSVSFPLPSPFIWMMIHSCDSLIFNTEVVPVSLTNLSLCLKYSGKVSFK